VCPGAIAGYFHAVSQMLFNGLEQRPGATTAQQAGANPNPAHDFDFELGIWKIHLKRRWHPLSGSNTWVEFDGSSVSRKVWEGRSQIEQFETDSPSGHIEGLTLRLYNPDPPPMELYWANSKDGILVVPRNWPIQEWARRVLRPRHPQRQVHSGSIHLVKHPHKRSPLRTIVFRRRWQTLGGELDHRSDTHPRRRI
jgi:hypothetical protein